MKTLKNIVDRYNKTSLIIRIIIGLVIGAVLGLISGNLGVIALLGDLFVGALKAIAPVLVFVLVVSALAQGNDKLDSRFGTVIALYMISTFLASVIAVIGSFIFPQTLKLSAGAEAESVPTGIGEVLGNLLKGMVGNPINSIAEGRYIGILFWAAVIGIAAKKLASDTSKKFMEDIAEIVSCAVRWIINLAP